MVIALFTFYTVHEFYTIHYIDFKQIFHLAEVRVEPIRKRQRKNSAPRGKFRLLENRLYDCLQDLSLRKRDWRCDCFNGTESFV